MAAESWIHVIVTLIAIPVVLGAFAYFIKGKDATIKATLDAKDSVLKENIQLWHDNITQQITSLAVEVKGALNASSEDRKNIWERLYGHGHEIDCKQGDCHVNTKGLTIPSGRRD
jgi:hypothetical protein